MDGERYVISVDFGTLGGRSAIHAAVAANAYPDVADV
jgi:hypothetical protein